MRDAELGERIRMLRFHGSKSKKTFEYVGYNSRLDEIQAAALRIFLRELDGWTAARREAAARYAELGLGELCEIPADEPGHVYHLFVCRSPERDRIRAALTEAEIGNAEYYLPPLHLQPALRYLGYEEGALPETERASPRELLRAALGGHHGRAAGARRRRRARSRRRRGQGVRIPFNRHRLPQLAADLAIVVAAWFLAFRLRFDPDLPVYYERYLSWQVLGLVVAIKLSIFALFGFYNRWWRYVSTRDMWGAARGVVAASLVTFLVFSFFDVHAADVPRTVWVIDGLLTLAFVAGSRMLARTIIERPQSRSIVARGKEVIVVGAGDAAQLVLREMLRMPALGYTPIGLIDDDPRKKNLRLHGIRVLGTTDELPHVLRDRRPDEVLIAIPSASGEQRARIVEIARKENVPVKTLPGLNELITGDRDLAVQIRPVQVEDLLGREPVEVDLEAIHSYLAGKTVLVTGAGGSIGSELCRQIARAEPQRIVLVDQGESALFDIERELVDERQFAAGVPVLADVRDRNRMRQVFERYRPAVVFHAAAYKHVPLMEANPLVSVAQQRARHAGRRRRRDRVRRRALRADLDRQGAEPAQRLRPDEDALRVDRRLARRARRRDDEVRRRSLRQRAQLGGERDPALPPPDRARRPGDGHRRGDDALLHDDPRGGRARRPGRRDRRPRPHLRARHGRADPDPRPGPQHDPALGQGARGRRRRSPSSAPARARRSTRSCSRRTRRGSRPRTRRSSRSTSPRSTAPGSTRSWTSWTRSSRRARRSSSSAAWPRSCASRGGWWSARA